MFVNISNHQTNKWDKDQYNAATEFGSIIDVEFPLIPPVWDSDEVYRLATNYYSRCKNLIADHDSVVFHVAGEPVFCFYLIQLLLEGGFKVMTSTTQRKVVEEGDKKISVFKFVRFREYKIISHGK